MAYAIKWVIPFVNDKGESREIDILVDGYTGNSSTLTGGAVPISTQESTDEDMMAPIRTQTGYINVLDNGDIDGIIPSTNTKHKVELVDDDGTVYWTGYIKAAEYSSAWVMRPNEVQLPIISRVEALGSIDMDATKAFGMNTFGELIAEAANAIGIVDEVWLPADLKQGNGNVWMPMKLSVARANFFEANDGVNYSDPDYKKYKCNTYKEMLSKICKVLGWCLHEREQKWIFTTPTTNKYIVLAVTQLAAMATTTTISCTEEEADDVLISAIEPASTDQKRDVLQGCRTFEVEAKLNSEDDFLPKINAEDFARTSVDARYDVTTKYVGVYDVMHRHGWTGRPKSDLYSFTTWDYKSSSNTATETTWSDQLVWGSSTLELYNYATAAFGKIDFYKQADEDSGEKKRYSYNEGIIIKTINVVTSSALPTMPIVKIRGRRLSNVYGGAIFWNPSIIYDNDGGQRREDDKIANLNISVRIGDKWWNGTTWQSSQYICTVAVNEDGDGVVDQKTLSMPYNDAEGYIMPIDGIMAGEIELTIYAVTRNGAANIMLTNASLEYAKAEAEEQKNESSTNNYFAANESSFTERKKVSVDMATDNNNAPGYGILYLSGEKVSDLTFDEGRLESVLLGKLKRFFGRNIEKLTLNVEADDKIHPMSRIVKDGVHYQLLSEARDWMADESTIICESLPADDQ